MVRPLPPNVIVKIIPEHDGKVCEICRKAARAGPYSMKEIRAMQQKYDEPGFLHPRCRCTLAVEIPKTVARLARKQPERDILSKIDAFERAEKEHVSSKRIKSLASLGRKQSKRE